MIGLSYLILHRALDLIDPLSSMAVGLLPVFYFTLRVIWDILPRPRSVSPPLFVAWSKHAVGVLLVVESIAALIALAFRF
ncbi:MAG: hypothetical protein OXG19_01670 [Chloroflexi bacterium]|nr:hypothetical protein [Chloroflexota bacterium]